MIGELLGLFKYPVTTFGKRAEERNIKKEAIISAIIAMSYINSLTLSFGGLSSLSSMLDF